MKTTYELAIEVVEAVQKLQSENGLEVDGKVGTKTLKKMSEIRK